MIIYYKVCIFYVNVFELNVYCVWLYSILTDDSAVKSTVVLAKDLDIGQGKTLLHKLQFANLKTEYTSLWILIGRSG